MGLFVETGRWASAHPENFLTDAFAEVLRVCREREQMTFTHLMSLLSGLDESAFSSADFDVSTQIETALGYPDMQILGDAVRVLVEVKDRSPVDISQLQRYLDVLTNATESDTALSLLTRNRVVPDGLSGQVNAISWGQVGTLLESKLGMIELDPVVGYLIHEFLDLLEEREMAIKRVGWELNEGIQQFQNLKALLRDALESVGAHRVWAAYGADFNGVAIPDTKSNNSAYWWFVEFNNPSILVFSTYAKNVLPEFVSSWERRDAKQLHKKVDLAAESVHFFARNLASQNQFLSDYAVSILAELQYDPEDTE